MTLMKQYKVLDNKSDKSIQIKFPYLDCYTDRGINRMIEKERLRFYKEWYEYIKDFE